MTYMRYFRENKGFSQTRLSQLTGIPQSKLSRAERGRHKFNYERTLMLARILLPDDVDPDMLYREYK